MVGNPMNDPNLATHTLQLSTNKIVQGLLSIFSN